MKNITPWTMNDVKFTAYYRPKHRNPRVGFFTITQVCDMGVALGPSQQITTFLELAEHWEWSDTPLIDTPWMECVQVPKQRNPTPQERIDEAIDIADKHDWEDGDQHKMWIIDQMVRALLSVEDYSRFVEGRKRDGLPWSEGLRKA